MKKVITFGEIMLRLSPVGYKRFVQADSFEAHYGGAEANVAVSLAHFGVPTALVTKVPEHQIGGASINELRKYGVDTEYILRGGDRLGVYYAEKGASQRSSLVLYDRAGSSIATASREEFDWERIFQDAEWFHFTGITPALSDNLADICLEACKSAKQNGLTVSCDINYRNKLWSKDKANSIMSKLMEFVDVCIANEEDAKDVFSISDSSSDIEHGILSVDGYKSIAKQLQQKFDFKSVAFTLRASRSASDNSWSGMLFDGEQFYLSREYDIHIVDRIGGGDSFAAGLIYGFINQYSVQDALNFAVASGCLKQSIEGDNNLVSVEEVLNLVNGKEAGRVVR